MIRPFPSFLFVQASNPTFALAEGRKADSRKRPKTVRPLVRELNDLLEASMVEFTPNITRTVIVLFCSVFIEQ